MADKHEMAKAIMELVSVDDTGLIHFGPLDRYADRLGVTEDEADWLIDEALELLEEDGTLTEIRGSHYVTEDYEEWLERDREEREDWEQYQTDMAQSYHLNIWG